MYIGYDIKIKIIAYILFLRKINNKVIQKIIIIYINYLIAYYNNQYLEEKSEQTLMVGDNILDIDQRKAVYVDEAINLVLAGAGSGKTLCIVAKINYLIEEKGVMPEEIICFSFTNEACDNLVRRLKYNVEVKTFHSFAYSILRDKYCIDNKYLDYVIDEYFKGIIINNKRIFKKLLTYISVKKNDYFKYLSSKKYNYLKKEIYTFINLFKSNGYDFFVFLKKKKFKFKFIISIIIDIYYLYMKELESMRIVDLDTLIVKATNEIKRKNFNYKYIIIDEFQDISRIRYNLINELIKTSQAKLFAVGDDYQAIYKFSGCDVDYLLKLFNRKYDTKVIYLKNNYRCCQEIVNASMNFIIKNKKQIKKSIIAHKTVNKPLVIVKEKDNILKNLLNYLDDTNDILILGRNNKDINRYLNSLNYKEENVISDNRIVPYKTVHSAKGLEAEYIILLNLCDDILGFPSKLSNSCLIENFFKSEKFLFAEERRLFYVALTRAKSKVFLLSPSRPSVFLQEIIKNNKKNITYLNF